jgi:hypothetical protein
MKIFNNGLISLKGNEEFCDSGIIVDYHQNYVTIGTVFNNICNPSKFLTVDEAEVLIQMLTQSLENAKKYKEEDEVDENNFIFSAKLNDNIKRGD